MSTIYDVAKAAGVSPKTVSRVLNGDAPVGKKTRAAVEKAMAELSYVPSNAARMMRSNKSGVIGLITGAISFAADEAVPNGLPDLFIVQGIQKVIAAQNKTLMIADTGGSSDAVPNLMRTFLQHRVEGLIYVADYHREVSLPVDGVDCPVVLVNCFDATSTPSVVPDDREGQRALVTKIIQSGHRRIGFLTLDRAMTAEGLRYKGYRDALESQGIPYSDELVAMAYGLGGEETSEALDTSLGRLLDLPEPPTVICCGNDAIAMRVYGLLRARGVKVPEQMSVAGFDDYRVISEMIHPPLTTVVLPYHEMGRRAAERLLSLVDGADDVQENPVRVAGPVSWRSSVTPLNDVSIFNPNGRKRP